MLQLADAVGGWLKMLPKSLEKLRRTQKNIKDPLYRYFEREVSLGANLLETVRADLHDVCEICRGARRQTNHHRLLTQALTKGRCRMPT